MCTDNMGSNPGLAALWEDERQRRRDAGQASQITPQDSQGTALLCIMFSFPRSFSYVAKMFHSILTLETLEAAFLLIKCMKANIWSAKNVFFWGVGACLCA